MATVTELGSKVEFLEKSLKELQDAIRRLSQENASVVASVAKVTNELSALKTGLNKVQKDGKVNTYGTGVSKY